MSLKNYMKEVGKHEVPTKKEEIEYATELNKQFNLLLDKILSYPEALNHIVSVWEDVKNRNRATNKLAEKYGNNVQFNSKDLALQVDRYIKKAKEDPSKSAEYLKKAELTKQLYLSVIPLILDSSQISEKEKLEIKQIQKNIQKYQENLVNSNLRLVVKFARNFRGYGVDLEDLIQEGNIGLIKAVDKFDPDRGLKFSTYASWWIKQGFIKALRGQGKIIRLPSNIHDLVARMYKAREELEAEHSREPTFAEISRKAEVSEDFVEHLIYVKAEPISIEAMISSDSKDSSLKLVKDLLADDSEFLEEIDQKERREQILKSATERLLPIEKEILFLRYGIGVPVPMSLEAVAEEVGKPARMVKKLETTALSRLKEHSPELYELWKEE